MLYSTVRVLHTRKTQLLNALVPTFVPASVVPGSTRLWQAFVGTQLRHQFFSTKICCRDDPNRPDCSWEHSRKQTAQSAEKLKALGAEEAFLQYNPLARSEVSILENWYASGPPPLSEYRLTFGKHRGKKIDQVPDTYLVKYLIARHGNLRECPMIHEAVEDFMKRHPDVKSQAGRGKTRLREGGIPTPIRKPIGRPRKLYVHAPEP
jgi:hypothetical protein